jgi:uncharacterized membrane protein
MKLVPHPHPGVRRPGELTRGERAADKMKGVLATWTALLVVSTFIVSWILLNGVGVARFDPRPFILLNLFLSMFAAVQCFVLLIANKRGEQIAAEIAVHTASNTDTLLELLEANTELTKLVHDHILGETK